MGSSPTSGCTFPPGFSTMVSELLVDRSMQWNVSLRAGRALTDSRPVFYRAGSALKRKGGEVKSVGDG